jgi:hypothetical protein
VKAMAQAMERVPRVVWGAWTAPSRRRSFLRQPRLAQAVQYSRNTRSMLKIALQTLFEEQASCWIIRTDASRRPLTGRPTASLRLSRRFPICSANRLRPHSRPAKRAVSSLSFSSLSAEAIKVIRDIASLGFKEAKDLVESDRQGTRHQGGGREDQGRAGGGRRDGRAQAILTIIDLSPEARAALEADDAPLGFHLNNPPLRLTPPWQLP